MAKHISPEKMRWVCDNCGYGIGGNQGYCPWCGPEYKKPKVEPRSESQTAIEIYTHLITVLRKIKADLKQDRMRAHHFGIHGCGLKHIEEEIEICASKLEKLL
jgi:hypothetical protein